MATAMSARDRLLNPQRFAASLTAFGAIPLLRAGLQLGLFEALRTPHDPASLAARTGLAHELVLSWARALHAQGWLRREGGSYQIAPVLEWLLDAPEAAALHALIDEAVQSFAPRLAELPELMKGIGRPERGDGKRPARAATMTVLLERPAMRALLRVPGASHARRILDVGCGPGGYLVALLSRRRDAQGVGVERDPEVAEQARHRLREADLARRAEIRTGDFMTLDLPRGSFDLVTFNHNLHHFSEAAYAAVVRRVRERLVAGGVLAVQTWAVTEHPLSRWLGLAAGAALIDLVLRLQRDPEGLPDPALLHRALRAGGFEATGEVRVLPGGAVRYVWGRLAASS
jgi:SAM-dependent methyltransferase